MYREKMYGSNGQGWRRREEGKGRWERGREEGGEDGDVLSWHSSLLLRETIGIECGPRVVHTLPPRPFLPYSGFFFPYVLMYLLVYLVIFRERSLVLD